MNAKIPTDASQETLERHDDAEPDREGEEPVAEEQAPPREPSICQAVVRLKSLGISIEATAPQIEAAHWVACDLLAKALDAVKQAKGQPENGGGYR